MAHLIDLLLAALFGAVQGITEFFPISSSGHLVILHDLFPSFTVGDQVGFDVALHVGTFVALVVFFWKDIKELVSAVMRRAAGTKDEVTTKRNRLAWFIVAGTIPAATVGFVFEAQIEDAFRTLLAVAVALIIGAVAFLIVERVRVSGRDGQSISLRDALVIGCAQVFAFVPGISRSGSTIVAGRALGLGHYDTARFSFLLSLPVVFAAAVKKALDLRSEQISSGEWQIIGVGFLVSTIVGIFAIRGLLRYFRTHSLRSFAIYRLLLAAAIIIGLCLR